jgi:hypothetical protein
MPIDAFIIPPPLLLIRRHISPHYCRRRLSLFVCRYYADVYHFLSPPAAKRCPPNADAADMPLSIRFTSPLTA